MLTISIQGLPSIPLKPLLDLQNSKSESHESMFFDEKEKIEFKSTGSLIPPSQSSAIAFDKRGFLLNFKCPNI